MIVRAAPPEHFGWLCRRVGYAPTLGFRAIEVVDSDGKVRGMVGYDLFTPNSVWTHIALESVAAGRGLLQAGFAYPFVQLGLKMMIASVASSNEKSKRLVEHLGFREVHRFKDGMKDGEDLILYQLNRDECRWLSLARKAA